MTKKDKRIKKLERRVKKVEASVEKTSKRNMLMALAIAELAKDKDAVVTEG